MLANAKSSSAARTSRKLVASLAAALALSLALPAAAAERPMTPEEVQQEIQRAEDFFNDIDTLQARFVQVSSDGTYGEGDVYLDRPGKMRFEYDPPIPALMMSNGTTFLYYDKQLEQATFLPLWETPLWFLLDDETDFNDSDAPVEITHVTRTPELLILTMIDPKDEYQGKLELIFTLEPYTFKSWRVIDSRGIETEVTLVGMERDISFSDSLFQHDGLPGTGFERGPGK